MLLTVPPLSNQILQQHANARKYHVKINTSIDLHIINSPTVHLIPLFLSLLISFIFLSLLISFNLFLSLSISSYRFLSLTFLLWLVTLKGFERVPRLPMALLLLRAGKSPSSFGRTPWETSLHEFECLHDTAVVLCSWTNSSLHHASQLDMCWCVLTILPQSQVWTKHWQEPQTSLIWDSSWDHVNVQKLFSMCMHFIALDQGCWEFLGCRQSCSCLHWDYQKHCFGWQQ